MLRILLFAIFTLLVVFVFNLIVKEFKKYLLKRSRLRESIFVLEKKLKTLYLNFLNNPHVPHDELESVLRDFLLPWKTDFLFCSEFAIDGFPDENLTNVRFFLLEIMKRMSSQDIRVENPNHNLADYASKIYVKLSYTEGYDEDNETRNVIKRYNIKHNERSRLRGLYGALDMM